MAEEKRFENRLKNYFHSIGIYPAGYGRNKMTVPQVGWYTKIWGGGYQKAGIPDIIVCVEGLFLSVEVKAPNGRASDLQKLNTNRIRDSGGNACFLYPSGFEQFKEDVRRLICARKYKANFEPRLQEVYK